MGLTGLITAAIVFACFALLIYYCCRIKRKRSEASGWQGVVRSNQDVNTQIPGPYHQEYPATYPAQQQNSYSPFSAGGNSIMNPNAAFNNYSTSGPVAYPNPYGYGGPQMQMGGPNTPYPDTGNPPGMPMPMPMSVPMSGVPSHSSTILVQTSAPYQPSAPSEDLPPPYHAVMGQQQR